MLSRIVMDTYKGQQRPSLTESDRLARTSAGKQELSGYSENNDRFVATADNPVRFITHYSTRYVCSCRNSLISFLFLNIYFDIVFKKN